MPTHISLLTWPDSKIAYKAFSAVKSSSHIHAFQAAVLERASDGRFSVKDIKRNVVGLSTFSGGLTAGLVGILGGSLGILLGFSNGSLFGSVVDFDRLEHTESTLASMSRFIPPGTTALLLEVDQGSLAMVHTVATELSGKVLHRSLAEVEVEVLGAEAAAVVGAREASQVLREASKATHKAESVTDWEQLKQRFKSVFA